MKAAPTSGQTAACAFIAIVIVMHAPAAQAQRAGEDAVAEALNAFGSSVGREVIGLYSAGSARGFSPVQAGNLRIDGLYFDQGANFYTLSTRVVRRTAVSVGISAQKYLFAAPTGIVDYALRVPGDQAIASLLIGSATYGEAYEESDFELPLVRDVLSMGGGLGYTRNVTYNLSAHSDELTAGWIARWQPSGAIEIVPFWDMTDHRQRGEEPHIYIDHAGAPRFYSTTPAALRWADWSSVSSDFGVTARLAFGGGWLLSAGLFRAVQHMPVDYLTFLFDTNRRGQGDFSLNVTPAESSGATSGEIRLARTFDSATLRNVIYLRVTGRDSSIESATGKTVAFGPATITRVPPVIAPDLDPGAIGDVVTVHQITPGIAYSGLWKDALRLTLALQKVDYHRSESSPGAPATSVSNSPWLASGATAVAVTKALLIYGSYTQGFEQVAGAPDTALNRNEPVPAQATKQLDAGMTYQLSAKLQFLAGVFEIDKPYFNIDQADVYRRLGSLRNRGIELSLTGDLIDQLYVVSGVALIQAVARHQAGEGSSPGISTVVGPVPGYMSTNLEYRPARIGGLTLGLTVNTTSSRFASWPSVNLPPVTTLGADARYQTRIAGHAATFWLRGYNLTDAYGLTPDPNGRLFASDPRRFELSLEADL